MTQSLFKALSEFNKKVQNPAKNKIAKVKTKSGFEYEMHYAGLDDILNCSRVHLANSGLSVIQRIDIVEGKEVLITDLCHESGEFVSSKKMIPQIASPQEYGSYLTYLRRYTLSSILGLAGEEDDDANLTEPKTQSFTTQQRTNQPNKPVQQMANKPDERRYSSDRTITQSQAKMITDLAAKAGNPINPESLRGMSADEASKMIESMLPKKKEQPPKPSFKIDVNESYTNDQIPF